MLLQLEISNIALIDRLKINFEEGLNILTGETGAGKSIIIDSINALLGMRVSRELIRTGQDIALVEGIFSVESEKVFETLKEIGVDREDDGTLLISREMTAAGRNVCRVNGRLVTVTNLRQLGEKLIDIHGQHDSQSLLRTESHVELLDAFGGEKIKSLKKDYVKNADEYRGKNRKLIELSGNTRDRERKIDLLKYQIDEIEKAQLEDDEEEKLKRRRLLLANSEKILTTLSSISETLSGGSRDEVAATDQINLVISGLEDISAMDDVYVSMLEETKEILYRLEDITREISHQKEIIEFNPEELDDVEERIDFIQQLKRKYGSSIKEILEYCLKSKQQLDEIINNARITEELEKEMSVLRESIFRLGCRISDERKKAAQVLEKRICSELEDLQMKGASFKVDMEMTVKNPDDIHSVIPQNGFDNIEFMVSANTGEPLKPLSKTASGGEMSRIMLAIKRILADVDKLPTLIFDEIDIGIGGQTANRVGDKLRFISERHQVICVTHLAQIACKADAHYRIEKTQVKGHMATEVRKLKEEKEIIEEIARIMGGSDKSEASLRHAGEMLERSLKAKQ